MVRFPVQTANQISPLKNPNGNSNFLSKKQQCLSLLQQCTSREQLSQIQAQIHVSGLQGDTFLLTQLFRFYALSPSNSKDLKHARNLIDHSNQLQPILWNLMIRGYASSSDSPREAILLFRTMKERGIKPNKLTFPFILKACAAIMALKEGKQIQVDFIKFGLDSDVYVQNNLIHFYGSCKKILDVRKVFDDMSDRTIVSWNAMLTACVENACFSDAIECFRNMRNCGFEPDETTMVVMLSVCSELGNFSLGRWIHSQAIERGLVLNCQLGTSIVEMYAKSGALGYARLVFDRLGERNVWTWSAMILGLAQHGFAKDSMQLFSKMKNSSVSPNYVTFLGVLCACSHAGLVDEGYQYFHDMEYLHGIKPMMVHYGAMVDILGRAGRLSEAYTFIMNMPIEPDPVVWRTLLSACNNHEVKDDDGIGERVRQRLLELEPRRSGNLVIVANMYAETGMWEEAANIRRQMKNGRMKKSAGESWIELDGSMHSFFSGYDSEGDYEDMYKLLHTLILHMKMTSP